MTAGAGEAVRRAQPRAIHQFVPTFEPGAVGAHTVQLREVVRGLGLDSEVFAEHVRWPGQPAGRDFREYGRAAPARPGDVLLYQSAIGSTVADFVLARPERLVVNYHNLTPAEHFAGWEPGAVYGLGWGRKQLAAMAERTVLGIADSAFNEGELVALGYRRTAVAPVLFDLAALDVGADEVAEERLRTDRTVWLFVSRVAPHKAQHDLLKAFAVYRRAYDPGALLRIVGASSSDTYVDALRDFAAALDLGDAVELTGGVTPGELAAHYRTADVFVCLSDHEGFGVPLLEAMHHRLPVVAFASTAVPETLGGAGLLLTRKRPATVAAAAHRLVTDTTLRAQLVATGSARLADFDLSLSRRRMAEVLQGLVAG